MEVELATAVETRDREPESTIWVTWKKGSLVRLLTVL